MLNFYPKERRCITCLFLLFIFFTSIQSKAQTTFLEADISLAGQETNLLKEIGKKNVEYPTLNTTAPNTPPTFTGTNPQALALCMNSGAASINTLLIVSDINISQTETWTVTSAPANGTLGGFNATASSGSTSIAPTGLTYTPNTDFSGSDAFTIQVSDGIATASMTVNVTVYNPLILTTANDTVCATATGHLIATASTGAAVKWYDQSSGGTLLSTGDTLQIANASTTATYYAEANVSGTTNTVTSALNGTNSNYGVFFDILPLKNITLNSISYVPVSTASNVSLSIYYKSGTSIGSENTSAAWTLLGSTTITSVTAGAPTLIPISLNQALTNGTTYGIYVACSSTQHYSNAAASGTVFTTTSDLKLIIGKGIGATPFTGSLNANRMFNGIIGYTIGSVISCTSPTRSAATLKVNQLPTAYTVTGGGAYCENGSGVDVSLSNSDLGINYQLFNGVAAVGSPVAGTGSSIDFGSQTDTGTYTVQATNATTSCGPVIMTGNAVVAINPLPTAYDVTGGGTYCSGGVGADIGLSGSDIGINYQLYSGLATIGSPVPGTGSAIDFGNQTDDGSYYAIGSDATTGCSNTMSLGAFVSVNPLPTVYTVTGGGAYCSGGIGVDVSLSNSDIGTNYQLFNGLSAVGSPVPGTGSALDFGNQTVSGTYTVQAADATTSCSNTMSGSVDVTINSLPDITLGTSPSVVEGSTSATLSYTATIGSPTTYTITYDAAALTAGFVNVSNVTLSSSPIVLAVPPTAAPGVYNGTLTVSNGTCSSVDPDFTVTILSNTPPSFTNGNPLPLSVCQDAGLTSINNLLQVDDIDAGQQETWSLSSVPVHGTAFISYNTVSTGSTLTPSTLNYIPDGGYSGQDSFNVQVSDGFDSTTTTVNVTVNASPTITLGPNPLIGGGTTIANLPYTATTGSPTSYSVTYDANALTAGFSNVSTTALSSSPISLLVPGSAAWQTYNGSIVVSNGCLSSPVPFTITVNNPLPVTLVSFNGFKQGNNIQTQWLTTNEINTDKFILEKSNGGIVFNAVAEISAKDAATNNYSFTDNDPNVGTNLYRLKIIDKSGFITYSTIISVMFKASTASMQIYPNPGNIKSFKLKMMNAEKGKYLMQVFDVTGLLVHKTTIINSGSEQSLRLPANITTGTYTISLQNGQTVLSQKIIVQ